MPPEVVGSLCKHQDCDAENEMEILIESICNDREEDSDCGAAATARAFEAILQDDGGNSPVVRRMSSSSPFGLLEEATLSRTAVAAAGTPGVDRSSHGDLGWPASSPGVDAPVSFTGLGPPPAAGRSVRPLATLPGPPPPGPAPSGESVDLLDLLG